MTTGGDWRFEVEVHPEGWRFPPEKTWVAGWIDAAITDVRARLGTRVILGLARLPHPRDGGTPAGDAGARRSGFSFLLAPPPGAAELRLEARENGCWREFFRVPILGHPAAPPRRAAPSLVASLGPMLAALLRRRARSPHAAWDDLADELMVALAAEPLATAPNPPFAGALEEPADFARFRYGRIPVTGWLAHPAAKITRLSAVIDPLPPTPIPHGEVRSDIAAGFPALRGRTDCAFAGEVALPADFAAPVLLKLFAELETGGTHLVFAQRFTPRFHAATDELPPQVAALAFARGAWALHRAAGRLGLSRRDFAAAARRIWTAHRARPAYRPTTSLPDGQVPTETEQSAPDASFAGGGLKPASTVISPADDMCVPDASNYFHLGRQALALVQQAMALADCEQVRAILDLPCGYGRVARWFRSAYPQATLTACDVQAPAVAFCTEHFGATGVQATVDGRHWESLPGPFDVIWCGSLLTHLDRDRWIQHLQRFSERLAPRGVLVFTSHGLPALDLLLSGEKDYGLPDAEVVRLRASAVADGFGYVDYPGSPGYGISVAQPGWLLDLVARETNLRVLGIRVAGWDQHQDVVVCAPRARPKPARPRRPGHPGA